jgi:hypothetical protein
MLQCGTSCAIRGDGSHCTLRDADQRDKARGGG